MNKEYFFSYEGFECDSYHLEFPASVPGVKCDACSTSWTGMRTLPQVCPTLIRKEIEAIRVNDPCCPVKTLSHYISRWELILSSSGIDISLRPGDSFLPATWVRPEHPSEPIAWPLHGPVVRKDVSDRLVSLNLPHVHLFPLRVQLENGNACTNPNYYALVIVTASSWEDWYKRRGFNLCTRCGRFSLPDDASKKADIECSIQRSKRILSECDVPNGAEMFLSHVYRGALVVSERVHVDLFPLIEGFVKVRKITVV